MIFIISGTSSLLMITGAWWTTLKSLSKSKNSGDSILNYIRFLTYVRNDENGVITQPDWVIQYSDCLGNSPYTELLTLHSSRLALFSKPFSGAENYLQPRRNSRPSPRRHIPDSTGCRKKDTKCLRQSESL